MKKILNYIIVDDDELNNALCSITITQELSDAHVKSFESPEEGLDFIKKVPGSKLKPSVLFLDINMPTLTGWEFMEWYAKFGNEIKKKISVYIVSSSIDERDKERAKINKYIKGFISKPITSEIVRAVASHNFSF